MNKIAILGASGHGKVIADIAEMNGYQVVFFDDAWPERQQLSHWSIEGDTDKLIASLGEFSGCIVAIGDNRIRLDKLRYLESYNVSILSLIHPSAVISTYTEIGLGTVIMAGAVINSDVKIGYGCIINTGATVDHDCTLGEAVHVSPGTNIAGGVAVGDTTWLGIGSSLKQGVTIADNVMVGAGAVVVSDIPAGKLAVGCPARFS